MDHGHGQLQPLGDAEGQRIRQGIHELRQAEALGHLVHPGWNFVAGQAEKLEMQLQVLPDRELRVKRKGLRHVAHSAAGGEIVRIQLAAEQEGLSISGGLQAGKHSHGGGLAAAIGA